ncbi:MAG: glycosyltransferase [Blastocatellia bacterium]|nr:glycosyltransferase [Blastocatellia bacterium]
MTVVFLVVTLGLVVERCWKLFLVRRFFQNKSVQAGLVLPADRSVSILQPILSGDPALWSCLESNLTARTTFEREFLWLVDDDDEPGLAGCRRLMEAYPQAGIRLVVLPPPPDGVNPKTCKLIEGLKRAQHTYLAVLDDDTVLPDHAFEDSVPRLEENGVGLVFGLPFYRSFDNLWSALVSAFVNSNSLLTYIPYTFISEPLTINGMFYVLRRDRLNRIGGFSGLEAQLCDDYAVARHIQHQGLRLVQTQVRHGIRTTVTSFRQYLNLITRWLLFPQASIMKSASWNTQAIFYGVAFLPTFFPFALTLAALWTKAVVWAGLLGGYLLFNLLVVGYLNAGFLAGATPLRWYLLIPLMQFLLPLHVVWSLVAPRSINWRGHLMRIHADGGFHFLARRPK